MQIDTTRWSGEGVFTQVLLDALAAIEHVVFLRAEDAPSTRSDADYNFISNEIYVGFLTDERVERTRRFGILPVKRVVFIPRLRLDGLEAALSQVDGIGPPDYSDDGLLQYLRTERVVPPYQTRGYKLVELVRIYQLPEGVPAPDRGP